MSAWPDRIGWQTIPPKSGHELTLGADGFNLLNRVNYVSYVGIISSPLFGTPVSARSARQFQFSVRYKF